MVHKLLLERRVNSLAETRLFAAELARFLPGGSVIGLIGPLGAGKTTLIAAILNELSCKEAVSSPTFVLQHIYTTPERRIEHWDLYRLAEIPAELFEPPGKQEMRFVEWFDRAKGSKLGADYLIDIILLSDSEREITLYQPAAQ